MTRSIYDYTSHMFHIVIDRSKAGYDIYAFPLFLCKFRSYTCHKFHMCFCTLFFTETNDRCDTSNCLQTFHFQTSNVICFIVIYPSVQNANI